MKMRVGILAMFALFILEMNSFAQSDMIHYWHFSNTLPTDGSGGTFYGPNPLYADYSVTTSKAYVEYKPINPNSSDTGSVDNVNGSKTNQRTDYGGCCTGNSIGLRLRNPSDNMEFLWYVPTSNYKNIVINYATKSSSFKSGQQYQVFSYSIDNGANFITTGLTLPSITPDTVWGLATLDLSSIAAANDNDKFLFRILFSGNNTGTKGNNRFDNISVEGSIINPNLVVNNELINNNYSLYPNPGNDILNLKSGTESTKIVSIYSSMGILVTEIRMNKMLSLNISNYNQGLYFVNIREQNGTESSILKFMKN